MPRCDAIEESVDLLNTRAYVVRRPKSDYRCDDTPPGASRIPGYWSSQIWKDMMRERAMAYAKSQPGGSASLKIA